ncbi:CKS-domain-containing protein [Auriscalpium vulgare]|uniref:CKS-domain-containing protein n=1 Tax=Auriscalpium vulgare TaxID=40419 RepID=A0ACB8SBE2_9AGAM|nr:CKS-domain-containing protein [Auriscalpium vulgare]
MATKQAQQAQQAQQAAQLAKQQAAAEQKKIDEYIEKIHYSDRYSDDEFEYRHVILPKPLFKLLPKHYFSADDSGTLRLLKEEEWRGIGITQSLGWEHYEVHAPEPHVLLFRRPKDFDQQLIAQQQAHHSQQQLANGKVARKK